MKRVIGVPGDRIKIVDQKVYRNGERLNEPYAFRDPAAPYDPFLLQLSARQPRRTALQHAAGVGRPKFSSTSTTAKSWCRPDKYFAMGDNRDHSWDSRYWGFVDRDADHGRPVVIYWSGQSSRRRVHANDRSGAA